MRSLNLGPYRGPNVVSATVSYPSPAKMLGTSSSQRPDQLSLSLDAPQE